MLGIRLSDIYLLFPITPNTKTFLLLSNFILTIATFAQELLFQPMVSSPLPLRSLVTVNGNMSVLIPDI